MNRSSSATAARTRTFVALPADLQDRLCPIWSKHSQRLTGMGSTLPVLCRPVEWHDLPRDGKTPVVCVLQAAGRYSPEADAGWRTARAELLRACASHGVQAVIPAPIWLKPSPKAQRAAQL